jgi:prepilin-type processing-associated H-X9-DG protein
MSWILDSLDSRFTNPSPSAYRNANLWYFGNRNNMVFADGHAKNVAFKMGCLSGDCSNWDNRIGSPMNFQERVDGYCADPDGIVNPFPRNGFPLGTGWTCKAFLAFPEAAGVEWIPN